MNQKTNAKGVRRNPASAKSRNLPAARISLDNANNATSPIKVLVGTHKTQGQRSSDFCWVADGEPLYLGFECDSDREPDDRCGCHRSFCGMNFHKATTTALVVQYHDGLENLVDVYMASMRRAGWFNSDTSSEDLSMWSADFRRFIAGLQKFPVGRVVEKRGPCIQTRVEKC